MADFTPPPLSSHEGPAPAAAFTPPPLSSHQGPADDNDYISHAATSTWENIKGAFNLATGADLWNKAIDSARAGNYGEAAKAFQGIVDGPAARIGNGLLDTASVAAGHMKDAASKLIHGDAEGASKSASAAGLHVATVLAPHAEQAAENFKQGNYGAGAGDLTGDALAYLAAKGIHVAPEAARAVGDAASGAATIVKNAADHPGASAAVDALGIIHPGAASAIHLGKRIVHIAGKINDALSPGETSAAPEPFVPPGTMTSTAPTAYVGRPVVPDAAAPTPANGYYSEGGTVPATAAPPAAADPLNRLRDEFAQGFKFKDYADAVKNGAGATIDRLVDQQATREAPDQSPPAAVPPAAAPFTPPPLSSHEGPASPAAAPELKVQDGHADLKPAAEPAVAPQTPPPTVLQSIDQGIAKRRMPGMSYQDVDAYLESKRPQPPPGEPGEAAAPAETPPPPAAPAAPAAAKPPAPYGKQYITPGQVTKYAAENGLAEDDATAALEKQGVSVVDRASTNRVLHAIGAELGYNHATLSEIAHATYGTGLGKMTHEQMMELAEKLGNEQATKEPLATKRTGSPVNPAIAAEAEGSPLGGVVAQLPTGEIHADPVRFQYKAGMGQGGAGEELRGVTKFDPEKSGILSVWKDPADGKTYVVNGHHRLELAQRTGADSLTVRYIDAANAAEARAKGAMINIAEGRGTSIDAAKVFRDSGVTAEDLQNQGLSLTGSVAKEGHALANLEPNIFNKVVSGEMKPTRGALIGQVAEHSDQLQLAKLIQEREAGGKPMTDSQVGEMLRMQAPQVTDTQHSLFGDDEISRSLLAEKASVSDYIQSRLKQTRRTFNAVGNENAATRLNEAGNVIDADKNAAIAEATNQQHAVYQKLSTSTGPVSDALDEAAKALHAGQNPAIVKVRAYGKIEPILKQEADKLTGRGSAPGKRPEGSAQAGSSEAGRGKRNPSSAAAEETATISDLMR